MVVAIKNIVVMPMDYFHGGCFIIGLKYSLPVAIPEVSRADRFKDLQKMDGRENKNFKGVREGFSSV